MFRKDILQELGEFNAYYDLCYGCSKPDTDGWGDELCSQCQAEFDKNLGLVNAQQLAQQFICWLSALDRSFNNSDKL